MKIEVENNFHPARLQLTDLRHSYELLQKLRIIKKGQLQLEYDQRKKQRGEGGRQEKKKKVRVTELEPIKTPWRILEEYLYM